MASRSSTPSDAGVGYEFHQPTAVRDPRRNDPQAWQATDQDARRAITKGNIITIETLREGSDAKADWIEAALWAQVAALALVSAGVATALLAAI